MAERSRKPRQARSRESERKLMQATAELLAESGLEGASIPRVAARAGLTPGTVYRRFADKDALLQSVILTILEQQLSQLEKMFPAQTVRDKTLRELVDTLVDAMVASYRRNAELLGALRQFTRSSDDERFKREARELEAGALDALGDALMAKRDQFRHPAPEAALRMALVMLGSTLMMLFVDEGKSEEVPSIVPQDDEWVVVELTRMFMSYLNAQ